MLFKNFKAKGKETAYYTFIRYPQIIHYVDLLFCLVILPLIILLVPVDKWIKTQPVFVGTLVLYLYLLYFTYRKANIPSLFLKRKYLHIIILIIILTLITELLTHFPISDKFGSKLPIDFRRHLHAQTIWFFFLIVSGFSLAIEVTFELFRQMLQKQEIEAEKNKAELAMYKAQINPHFMFNVLTMIAIKVKKHRDEELYQTVTSFAGLMRGKLFRRNEVEIKLKEEMEIAGFYLYLQSERFKDIITYNIEWESDEIKECYVPRLCIEPIVENAVIHGLEPKGTEGRIRVAIREASEDSINIVVEDDGVGFNVNEMDDRKDNKNPRVGVMNIQRLIRNLYGDKYGVLFQSEIGKGTIVTVCLPMRKDRTV